jgi:hypothetical protein
MKLYKNSNIFKNKVKCIEKKEEEKQIVKKEEKMDSILDDEFMKTYFTK